MSPRTRNTLNLSVGHATAWGLFALLCDGLSWINGPMLTLLIVVPAGAAGAAATLYDTWRPRRLLNTAARPLASMLLGLVGGGVALTAITLLVWAFDNPLVQASTLVWVPACSTTVLLRMSARRLRPGRCLGCDYDVRGSLGVGVCPECGRDLRRQMASATPSTATQAHGKVSPIRV